MFVNKHIIGFVLSFILLASVLFCGCKNEDTAKTTEDPWADVDGSGEVPKSTLPEEAPRANSDPTPSFAPKSIGTGWVKAICLNVRDRGGTNSNVIGHVFKGDKLSIYETRGSWHNINDEAGYVSGWVSAGMVSKSPVQSDFKIPADYKGRKTPTLIEGTSAKYVGVATCAASCHIKPHAGFPLGPYGVWRDAFHGSAYETLKKPYARAFAKKRGINDPLTDWRCLKCHVTAYGAEQSRLANTYTHKDGVGCEACHGPGSKYLYLHFNNLASEETLEAMGFRIYDDLQERQQICQSCHNPLSPTYKPFNIEAFSKAIRHWENEFGIVGTDTKPDVLPTFTPSTPVPRPQPPPKKPPPPPPPPPDQPPPPTGDQRLAGLAANWDLNTQGGATKGRSPFPHLDHTTFISAGSEPEACLVCHHTGKPNQQQSNCSNGACHKFVPTVAAPDRKKAFHSTCKTCHRAENAGPQKCSECHV